MALKGRLHLTVLPQTWGSVRPFDCGSGEEPCPDDACRYRIDNPAHPEATCAIDLATTGRSEREVAAALGISGPAVHKIQLRAARKIAALQIEWEDVQPDRRDDPREGMADSYEALSELSMLLARRGELASVSTGRKRR